MLIALMLTLTAPVEIAPPDMVSDPEIVVTAQRFARWRGAARTGKSGWKCKTRTSSGNRDIDATSCKILIACLTEESAHLGPDADFVRSKTKPSQDSTDRVGQCLKSRRDAAIAAYTARKSR